jgi:hypothetical protein
MGDKKGNKKEKEKKWLVFLDPSSILYRMALSVLNLEKAPAV